MPTPGQNVDESSCNQGYGTFHQHHGDGHCTADECEEETTDVATGQSFIIQNCPGIQVKQEKVDDGYNVGGLLHVVNQPPGGSSGDESRLTPPPVLRPYGDGDRMSEERLQHRDCIIKKEPPDFEVGNFPVESPISKEVKPKVEVGTSREDFGSSRGFLNGRRKLGELITVLQSRLNAQNDTKSTFDTVPDLVPFSEHMETPGGNDGHFDSDKASTSRSRSSSPNNESAMSGSFQGLSDPKFSDGSRTRVQSSRSPSPRSGEGTDHRESSKVKRSLRKKPKIQYTFIEYEESDASGDDQDHDFDDENYNESDWSNTYSKQILHKCLNSNCKQSFQTSKGLTLHMNHCNKANKKESVPWPSNSESSQNAPAAAGSQLPAESDQDFYACPDCPKVYQTRNHLILHSLIHSKDFPHVCPVEDCNRAFKTEKELSSHEKLHKKAIYRCQEVGCFKIFRSKQGLKNHMLYHSTAVECPHECKECGKKYLTMGRLRQHLDTSHGQRLTCKLCYKVFSSPANLKQHKLVHSNDRPFACPNENCTKAFKTRGDLTRHVMLHSNLKLFLCPVESCGKSFRNKGDLKKHSIVHSQVRSFKCPECAKFFKSTEHLRKHRSHHRVEHAKRDVPLNRYKCLVEGCDKSFPVPIKLKRHLARHSDEKPFACDIDGCTRKFKVDEDLDIHKRKVHRILRDRWRQRSTGRIIKPISREKLEQSGQLVHPNTDVKYQNLATADSTRCDDGDDASSSSPSRSRHLPTDVSPEPEGWEDSDISV